MTAEEIPQDPLLTEKYLATVPKADKEELLAALLQWKAAGNPDPLIPTDHDVDGDGSADAFGLTADDQLTIIFGAKLSETVAESDGGGIEAPIVQTGGELVDLSLDEPVL